MTFDRPDVTRRLLCEDLQRTSLGPFMNQRPLAILIIDDEAAVRGTLSLLLSRSGFKVIGVEAGEEGIAVARREIPSLIFCDERLAGEDGYSFLRKLKGDALTRPIPVIMIGGTCENGLGDWRHEGAASFLAKPFEVRKLWALVRQLTAPEQSLTSTV